MLYSTALFAVVCASSGTEQTFQDKLNEEMGDYDFFSKLHGWKNKGLSAKHHKVATDLNASMKDTLCRSAQFEDVNPEFPNARVRALKPEEAQNKCKDGARTKFCVWSVARQYEKKTDIQPEHYVCSGTCPYLAYPILVGQCACADKVCGKGQTCKRSKDETSGETSGECEGEVDVRQPTEEENAAKVAELQAIRAEIEEGNGKGGGFANRKAELEKRIAKEKSEQESRNVFVRGAAKTMKTRDTWIQKEAVNGATVTESNKDIKSHSGNVESIKSMFGHKDKTTA